MEEALYTFTPTNTTDTVNLMIGLILAIAGIAGTIIFLKKGTGKQRNMYLLLAMLSFFLTIIAGGTAFFSWLSSNKTATVRIFKDRIETPYGTARLSDIVNARIEREENKSPLNQQVSRGKPVDLLLIEERNGKAHILSETNYPVREVMAALRDVTQADQ